MRPPAAPLPPVSADKALRQRGFRKMGAFSSSAMPNTDLFQFLKGSIRSVWALELLLLMRSSGGRVWRPDELVSELSASAPLVSGVLRTFHDAGLIREESGSFVYAPASPTLEAYCEELEKAYRERPVAVIIAIVASSTDDLQSFADAFRFRGGK